MMSLRVTLPVFLLCLCFMTACSSKSDPVKESLEKKYLYSKEHMLKSCREVLVERYQIASEDMAKLEITTHWLENLHPMSHFGRRNRLIITLEGSANEGWSVSAEEEMEENTEEKSPLDPLEADWKSTETDGANAKAFLWRLDSQLDPRETWRHRER